MGNESESDLDAICISEEENEYDENMQSDSTQSIHLSNATLSNIDIEMMSSHHDEDRLHAYDASLSMAMAVTHANTTSEMSADINSQLDAPKSDKRRSSMWRKKKRKKMKMNVSKLQE